MKTKALKTILMAAFSFLMVLPGTAQKGIEDGSKYGKGQDSINCIKNLSLYREFFKHNNYKDAIGPWRKVFGECPASSERMYVEGITMYRSFIESAADGPRKETLIDTMLLIYDRRTEYFGGEGNILGRKGIDLLRYRRTDIDALEEAYGYLKRSIELEQKDTRDAVIVTFVNSSITLNQADKITDNQSIDDYFMATALVDELLSRSSRWERAKATIDELMLNSGLLTCDALNNYFEPQFEANQNDTEFLQKVITFYSSSGCDLADLYIAAAEKMYDIDPGPISAHNLAYLFMRRNDFPKAAQYLKMAVVGEDIDDNTRAEWFYELAVVSSANEDFCDAIAYAREAISYKSDYGKAYITLGDAIIASRDNLGDDFEQRTSFWVAADKYAKARQVDPSVMDEATKKLNDYTAQYPDNEEIFFRDMKEGDSYQVKGCINEYTTVRARP
ncbi:MAG: tetratricopeptide repeat protein [Bacteroidales bacterium]